MHELLRTDDDGTMAPEGDGDAEEVVEKECKNLGMCICSERGKKVDRLANTDHRNHQRSVQAAALVQVLPTRWLCVASSNFTKCIEGAVECTEPLGRIPRHLVALGIHPAGAMAAFSDASGPCQCAPWGTSS